MRRNFVGKTLGNIPRQIKMSEEQEQTFTNGINKGRKLERQAIISLLEAEINNINNKNAEWYLGIFRAIALIQGDSNG